MLKRLASDKVGIVKLIIGIQIFLGSVFKNAAKVERFFVFLYIKSFLVRDLNP